jgi:hypothetical protein
MKWARLRVADGAALLAILLAPLQTFAMLDCRKIVVETVKFDLHELGGPHQVVTSKHHPPTFSNTTYTLDVCGWLKQSKDVKKENQCPNSTRGETRRGATG